MSAPTLSPPGVREHFLILLGAYAKLIFSLRTSDKLLKSLRMLVLSLYGYTEVMWTVN
jgi:hypothetical protein